MLSLPDTWEFPWFASWDLAFHTLPLALIDPEFAKRQLMLLTREWYMHPNGQLPAYEWAFGDVNPPVHAWGAWRVYTIERKAQRRRAGRGRPAVPRTRVPEAADEFHLVGQPQGRAATATSSRAASSGWTTSACSTAASRLPTGGYLEQSDATSWMAMYALNLLKIALELAQYNPVYEDIASKFFEHFLSIAHAMSASGGGETSLWNEEDGPVLRPASTCRTAASVPLKIHSMVSLIPLFAVEVIDADLLDRLPGFGRRFRWFMENRPELTGNISRHCHEERGGKLMLSIVGREQAASHPPARCSTKTNF